MAPALASPVAPATAGLTAAVAPAAAPNTTISGKPANWHPNKLTVKPVSKCSATSYSFTITNKSSKAQTIQEKTSTGKETLGKIAKGKKAGVCSTGSKGAKGTLYIKGSGKALTLTLS